MEGEEDDGRIESEPGEGETGTEPGAGEGSGASDPRTTQQEGTAAEPPPRSSVLDQLYNNPPAWLTELLDDNGTPLSELTEEDLNDPMVQRAVVHMVARGKQGASQMQEADAALAARVAELEKRERELQRRATENTAWARDPRFAALLQQFGPKEGEEEPDPYSPEAAQRAGKQAALEVIQAWIDSMTQIDEETQKKFQEQEQLRELQIQEQRDLAYIEDNEESFLIPGVQELTAKLWQVHGLPLEEAHQMAVARLAHQDASANRERLLELARERTISGGRGPGGPLAQKLPAAVEKMSPEEKAIWINSNPEVARAAVGKLFSGGAGGGY